MFWLTLAHLILAGGTIFLIGANIAFLIHEEYKFTSWFVAKITAVTVLLTFICFAALFASLDWPLTILGLVAIVADLVAFRLVVEHTGTLLESVVRRNPDSAE